MNHKMIFQWNLFQLQVFVSLNSDDEDDNDDDDDDDPNDTPLLIDDSNMEENIDNGEENFESPANCEETPDKLSFSVIEEMPKCPPNSVEKYSSSDIENSSSGIGHHSKSYPTKYVWCICSISVYWVVVISDFVALTFSPYI